MGFFAIQQKTQSTLPKGLSLEFLHRHGCQVCPLYKCPGNKNPDMQPTGSKKPLVYILGEGPGKDEDRQARQFVGKAGRFLKQYIPEDWLPDIRWNNVVRTRPPNNREPTNVEIEACFPADTLVNPIGPIKSLYRRWYNGPMVTIKTASGRILTGTPNHPVFTSKGEIPLEQVKIGDYAFGTRNEDLLPRAVPNINHKPTMIGKVFSSFFEPGKVKRVGTVPVDFHGDGMLNGKVNIIRSDCQLGFDKQIGPYSNEQFSQPLFAHSNFTTRFFVTSRSLDHSFVVLTMIASSDPFSFTSGCHPKTHLLRSSSYLDPLFFENSYNSSLSSFELTSEFNSTFSSEVHFSDLPSWELPPLRTGFPLNSTKSATISEFDPTSKQKFSDCCTIGFGQPLQSSDTGTIQVELDQVVSVETINNFRGHVYNLETGSHKYIAQDLIVSNCRPSIIADIEKTKPKAIFGFGNIPLYWALGESGITKWSGKRVPIKVGSHTCWFFPIMHPSGVLRSMDKYGRSDDQFKFELDVRHAFEAIDDLPEPIVHTKEDALRGVETITGHEPDALARIFGILENEMWNQEFVGHDLETNALRPYGSDAKLLSAAFSSGEHTLAFAIDHKDAGWSNEEKIELKKGLRHFLLKAPCRKISFNLPFEMEWDAIILKCKAMLWGSKWGDAMLQAYVLNPLRASDPEREDFRRQGHLSLRVITLEQFGLDIKDIAGVNRKNLAAEPLEKLLPYNGVDSKYHLLNFLAQRGEIKKAKLGKIYARLLKRIPTAVLTQIKGVPYGEEVVAEFEQQYTRRVNRRLAEMKMMPCVRKFKKVTGEEFNPGSNPDCKTLITKILGEPLEKGADEEALEKIKHPFAKALLAWRKAAKLRSTYCIAAGAGTLWPDKLLHPLLNIMRVVTSRTSSSDPNAQNWPKRTKGRVARRQIKPKVDEVVVALDYAGIQARNVAMESGDAKLVEVYWNHYDIHTDFTERLLRIYPEWIDEGIKAVARSTEDGKKLFKDYRNRVKNEFVFPSFFGATAKSVSGYLGVPIEIGEELREQFWDDFHDVPQWHDKLRKHYARHGWIAGLSGFRHPAPIAHTEIVNYPIQADEATIVCEAMAQLSMKGDDLLQANMMIHDDLTFILPKKKVDTYVPQILEEMLRINYDWINVPLEVEVSIGPDWYDLKEVGKYESVPNGGYKQI